LYSVEGVLKEKQVHVVAVVGTCCPKFVEKLHEQFNKRELKVSLNCSFFFYVSKLKPLTIQTHFVNLTKREMFGHELN